MDADRELIMSYHYMIYGDKIVCDDGHGGYSVIATIANNRACRQMLRHVQLAEDIELLMDKFIPETSGQWRDGPVPCPELPIWKNDDVHE